MDVKVLSSINKESLLYFTLLYFNLLSLQKAKVTVERSRLL